MHQCSMCPFFCHQPYELMTHLLKRHRHDSNFKVHCSAQGCGTSFKTYNAFQMHCKRSHPVYNAHNFVEIADDNNEVVMDTDNEVDNTIDANTDINAKVMDAHYILQLRAEYHLSQAAIANIILSTRCLFGERLDIIKNTLRQAIPPNVVDTIDLDTIFEQNLLQGLESEYLQDKFIHENFGYIAPIPIKLGVIKKQVKHRGQYQYKERDAKGYYVPFIKQLEQLLSMKEVQDCLQEDIKITDKMTDFYDGRYMSKAFFQNHPDALLFALYFDDFEIANPIGAHRKKHKLSIFYWSLINISPEFRFKLQTVQLLGVAKSSYIKKFGLNKFLSNFIDDMKKLNAGCDIVIGTEAKKMFGTLYCVLGDTLAAQYIGGFKEGVGFADKPCRSCEIEHVQLGESLQGKQFPLRNLQEHIDRCDYLDELNKCRRRYWSRKYGVTYRSCLLQILDFDVTQSVLHDPMHVLLEGIVKMELQLMLSELIYKKHYFSLKDLNSLIQNFNYTSSELNDRPQQIEKKSLDRKNVLPMTAVEIKNFMTLLPFMIGDKITEGDKHWLNFLRLIQITLLVISPVASDSTVDSLSQLIYEHNFNFKLLYPDVAFTPKLHFLTHFPQQILNFGPGRNHWCVRFEAKHNLFKSKKWKNFRAIEKSIAYHHQRWMCLKQLSGSGKKSEVYLYEGDSVKQGTTVKLDQIDANVKAKIEMTGLIYTNDVMETESVSIRGISYSVNDILILNSDADEPKFGVIENIYVVEHIKFVDCLHLEIVEFDAHINAFECMRTNNKSSMNLTDLTYKWPQISHFYKRKLHVMLYNVDFSWSA